MTDETTRAFEAWFDAEKEKTFPKDYDRSRFARWGESSRRDYWESWQAAWAASRAKAADECERMSAQGCDAGDCADALRATGGTKP